MVEREAKSSIEELMQQPREEIPSDEFETHPDLMRFDMLEPWIEYLKKMQERDFHDMEGQDPDE